MKDKRYTVRLEWCGYAAQRYVVRFCGEWVGCAQNRHTANELARTHSTARMADDLASVHVYWGLVRHSCHA
jgi:hypothetical protein